MSQLAHVRRPVASSLVLVACVGLTGCPGPEGSPDAYVTPGTDAYVTPGTDAYVMPGADAYTPSGTDWRAICTRIEASIASCSTPGRVDVCAMALARATERGCQARYMDALRDYVLSTPNAFGCVDVGFGPQPAINPSAPEFAVVGEACAGAVNNPSCYSISCRYNTDCPGADNTCNDATMHCTSGSCPGLPCTYNVDCQAAGTTCNNALGVCVRGS